MIDHGARLHRTGRAPRARHLSCAIGDIGVLGCDAPSTQPRQFDRLATFFSDELAMGRLPGAVVLISAAREAGSFLGALASRDVATAHADDSRIRSLAIHSMTKPITSLAAHAAG